MNENEPQPAPETSETPDNVETENIRSQMAAIESDIEAGNPLTPKLLGYFQELGAHLADKEADGDTARFLLAYDSAVLKFKGGFIEAAIEDMQELGDTAYQAGEQFSQIVEMADDKKAEYEAALARQPKA